MDPEHLPLMRGFVSPSKVVFKRNEQSVFFSLLMFKTCTVLQNDMWDVWDFWWKFMQMYFFLRFMRCLCENTCKCFPFWSPPSGNLRPLEGQRWHRNPSSHCTWWPESQHQHLSSRVYHTHGTLPKFNSSTLKNSLVGKTILSYWVSVTFQGLQYRGM